MIATNAVSISWNSLDFNTTPTTANEEIPYTYFEADPFPLICQMYSKSIDGHSIFEKIVNNDLSKIIVEQEYHDQASSLKSYFKHNIFLRRLKGDHVSEWMKKVEDIIEDPTKVKYESVKILVSLPKFYKENLQLDILTNNHVTVDQTNTNFARSYNFEFVTKIHRYAKQDTHIDFYWKTDENKLLRVRTKSNEYSVSAWEALSTLTKIKMNGAFGCSRIQGYDFWVLIPSFDTKIELR